MKVFFCIVLSAVFLVGCGGSTNTNDCTLGVNFCNVLPIANAGASQNVLVASTVTLDGNTSSDANGDTLTYSWQFLSRPQGSTATLAAATTAKPTFTADVAGTYQISLVVNDGKANSAATTTSVIASATNLTVVSASYSNGGTIPIKYAGTGAGGSNVSPQLTISDIPKSTDRFAIVMDDETAPCQAGLAACRHWGVFNLPVAKTAIAEGENLLMPAGGVAVQSAVVYGTNYTGGVGYAGPNPASRHTYNLTVYALAGNAPFLTTTPEYTRAKFERDFQLYILGKATLTGVYP